MLGGGLARGLVKKAVAASIAAGAGLVATIALGATIFYALDLFLVSVAAAAITCLLFAVVAAFVAMTFVRRGEELDEEDEDESRMREQSDVLPDRARASYDTASVRAQEYNDEAQ